MLAIDRFIVITNTLIGHLETHSFPTHSLHFKSFTGILQISPPLLVHLKYQGHIKEIL